MPTNLALDDGLIESARKVGRHKTKREAVNAALREYVKQRQRLGLLDLVGTVEYWDDYDYKALRGRKTR